MCQTVLPKQPGLVLAIHNDRIILSSPAFKEQAAKEGIQVKEEQYTADDKDFRALLTKIKGTNPEVIFVPNYYKP